MSTSDVANVTPPPYDGTIGGIARRLDRLLAGRRADPHTDVGEAHASLGGSRWISYS